MKLAELKRIMPEPLAASDPAEEAVYRVAESLLLTARQYQPGIIADLDPEYVHQYRVNIRKCRSLVQMFKKTLVVQSYQTLKTELKILGKRTNELRDLDVFLLEEARLRELLPESQQAGLGQLFQRVRQRREVTLDKLVVELGRADNQQLNRLLTHLQQAPSRPGKQARQPIGRLVGKKLQKQYRKICQAADVIDAATADEALHTLRIEGKKLRYLLELFGDLFDRQALKPLVRQLKGLQDSLGRFNDCAVQSRFLADLSQQERLTGEELASLAGLTAALYNRQLQERRQTMLKLADFADDSVARQVRRLVADLESNQQHSC